MKKIIGFALTLAVVAAPAFAEDSAKKAKKVKKAPSAVTVVVPAPVAPVAPVAPAPAPTTGGIPAWQQAQIDRALAISKTYSPEGSCTYCANANKEQFIQP